MKLSRSAWNNVIIFSVMAMILLINVTNDKLFPSTESGKTGQEQYILGDQSVILAMTVAENINIKRLGTTWQVSPELMSEHVLEQMMLAWQQSTGYLQDAPENISIAPSIQVRVSLAGQALEQQLKLYHQNHQLLIHNQTTDTWMSLPHLIYPQLIPTEIIGL